MLSTRSRIAAGLVAAAVLARAPARAATHVWNASVTSGNWSVAGNWSVGGVPTSGEMGGTVVQIGGGVTATDNIANLVIDLLEFTNGGNSVGGSGGVSLGINGAILNTNLRNLTGSNAIASSLPIVLSGASCGVITDAGSLTVASSISGGVGVVVQAGSAGGTTSISGTNSYVGPTTVSEGTLILDGVAVGTVVPGNLTVGDGIGGVATAVVHQMFAEEIADSSNVTINPDGRLILDSTETMNALTMLGGSITGAGTLRPSGVTATSDAAGNPSSIATSSLDLGTFQLPFVIAEGPAAVDLDVSSAIGNGGISKFGTGTLQYSGSAANTYTQPTFVNDGTLILAKSPGVNAISGSLTIGDSVGVDVLRLAADNQIADTVDVSVLSSGVLDLNGHSDAIASLQLRTNTSNAAQVATGAGTLTLVGDVALLANGTGAVGAVISGNLSLGGATRTFTIGNGAAAVDLNLAAVVSGSPGAGLVKAGTGKMRLSATSSYPGPTSVIAGALAVDGTLTASAVTAGSGILGGLGTVAGITATTGGVAPGDSPGILSSSQGVSFQAGSTFFVEIVGTLPGSQYDRLSVSGTASLGGTLNVSLGYSPALGDSFTILSASGAVSGTFAGLPEGSLIAFGSDALQVHYTSNAVVLTVSCTGPDSVSPAVTAPSSATVAQSVCQ